MICGDPDCTGVLWCDDDDDDDENDIFKAVQQSANASKANICSIHRQYNTDDQMETEIPSSLSLDLKILSDNRLPSSLSSYPRIIEIFY